MKPSGPALSISPNTPNHPAAGLHPGPRTWMTAGIVAVLALGAILAIASLKGPVTPHAPNLALLERQPLSLLIHMGAAGLALGIGTVLMLGVKGSMLHRTLGWIWSIAMVTVAGLSFVFPYVRAGHLSPIHLLSLLVLVSAPLGVLYARRHDIGAHRRTMTRMYMLALIVAGAFTFFPGRLMWRMFFG